jgi:peptide/nickel transport system permease protein
MKKEEKASSWWDGVQRRFFTNPIAVFSFACIALFAFIGIYAPFFASSKPIAMKYDGSWYFPLFRYLFYTSFYTKGIDLFFNIAIFTTPIAAILCFFRRSLGLLFPISLALITAMQLLLFFGLYFFPIKDPAYSADLEKKRQEALESLPKQEQEKMRLDWPFALQYLNDYGKQNLATSDYLQKEQDKRIRKEIAQPQGWLPTLWQLTQDRENDSHSQAYNFLQQRRQWLIEQEGKIEFLFMPIFQSFHWEDDAAGSQALNRKLPFWELTRINRKDFISALCFGIRISLVVGFLSVALALLLAIPIGAFAGYKGGTKDIIICRMMEIWESMPPFFMLLFVIAVAQSKSIFLIIAVIGLFSWTSFARYLRGEMLRQRSLPYVEACHAQGFSHARIIFSHLLPNAIPPLLTLLPFAIMGAITSEAGISFLGLGEEGSNSWGILMDEGRAAFPAESYLLWPPAVLLTILLIAIALVGDALRDAIDPKLS